MESRYTIQVKAIIYSFKIANQFIHKTKIKELKPKEKW